MWRARRIQFQNQTRPKKATIAGNRALSLVKGDQRYLFRYRTGEDAEIIDEITRLAQDAKTKVTWVDAAMLAFRVTQNAAIDCCNAVLKPPEPEPVCAPPGAGSGDPKDGPCTNSDSP